MVDRALLAAKSAAVRDAIARIRSVVPPEPAAFAEDRTVREDLVAHRYGVLDPALVHRIASHDLGDLEDFCAALAARAGA